MTPPPPQPSWRKPAGALLLVAFIVCWAVLVSRAMDAFPTLPTWASLVIYAVAGVLWIFPARNILIWMETGRWRA
jgi:hypothetical protein